MSGLSFFVCLALVVLSRPQEPTPRLLDRTAGAKLEVITWSGGVSKDHILESAGNGVVVIDFDAETWPDLYFVNAYRFPERGRNEPHANVLYRNNRDGTFSDVTEAAGLNAAVYGSGGCVGDIDGDGFPDLYVTNFGANALYRNNGDGTFTEITIAAGVGADAWSTGAAFFDAEGDGDPDLFVANYIVTDWQRVHAAERIRLWRGVAPVLDGPRGLEGAANVYYRNDGDGTFSEATAAAGFAAGADLYSFGVVALDYDDDSDPDVYVANDSQRNTLYRNDGAGLFTEIAAFVGVGYNADGMEQGGMGTGAGDLDGDGRIDLLVTNFANDYYTLYRNLGDDTFIDESFAAGIAVHTFTPLGWGVLLFDVELDGDLDVFFSNGHLYAQVDEYPELHETYRQQNQLFVNEGGRLTEVTEAGTGLSVSQSSRGAATLDLDNDGDLDLVVSNQDARPTLIENVTETSNHWLGIELVDPLGDRLALGARVDIVAAGRHQLREVRSGGSYMSQSDLRLHFGVGAATVIEQLRVRWRDGSVDTFENLPADNYYRLRRGLRPAPIGRAGTSKGADR